MNVWSVDCLSEEKTAKNPIGNVKTADTSTPKEKTEAEVSPIQIPKKAIALAKSVGIDLNVIVGAFEAQNKRLNNLEKGMVILAQTNDRLMPLVELAERAKQAQAAQASGQAMPQGQGGGLLGLVGQIMPALLSGGGGSSPIAEKFMTSAMEKAITGMDLSNALSRALIVKIAPEMAELVTKDIKKG